jgi:hypothetical protein
VPSVKTMKVVWRRSEDFWMCARGKQEMNCVVRMLKKEEERREMKGK